MPNKSKNAAGARLAGAALAGTALATAGNSSPAYAAPVHPNYWRVFLTFARNSLVREMTFRANFIIECISGVGWMTINLGFYLLVFKYSDQLGGWTKPEFFLFLATTFFVNSIVEALFMSNAQEFSELIRTGGLDFALLKPIDTQFLISLQKIDWASITNFLFGAGLATYALLRLPTTPNMWQVCVYPLLILAGVAIFYSIMIVLSATSVWLGRNQTLYDFWFYITNFSRYPSEIFFGRFGTPLNIAFTYMLPVLLVMNVPAKMVAKPLSAQEWPLVAYMVFAAVASLVISRAVFRQALKSYRSASS